MDISKEIEKILMYQYSSLHKQDIKDNIEINSIIEQVKKGYEYNNYDFSKFTDLSLRQTSKIRRIKKYELFSIEEVLCIYLKRILDRKFHIKYPNRNDYIHALFDIIAALSDMNDFSIYKFDFKDFFNTISSEYVFYKYILNVSLERYQLELLEKYVNQTKYAYAGLNTSNIICEIIAKHFDDILLSKCSKKGLIFFRRYIDDGVLIFNKHIEESECHLIINETINEVFYDNNIQVSTHCKTRINESKSNYICLRDMKQSASVNKKNVSSVFDFLGYEFEFITIYDKNIDKNKYKLNLKYGVTQKKIDKYNKRINRMINDYKKDNDTELLRHKIKAFTFRTVYQIKKNKLTIWKNKGFIANYNELRYRLDMLTKKTDSFLRKAILDSFHKNNIPIPYFLKAKQEESIYNLKNNMEKNRTLLFVEPIGIETKGLEKMCEQIGISIANKSYDDLLREYLIKVYIGF